MKQTVASTIFVIGEFGGKTIGEYDVAAAGVEKIENIEILFDEKETVLRRIIC